MYETINERVAVIARFPKDTYKDLSPFRLEWHGREYVIKELGYHHKYKQGRATIHVFSATDGVHFFELKFNTEDLTWLLGKLGSSEVN